MTDTNNKRTESLRLIAFSSPSFVTTLIHGPMVGILPAILVKYYGIEMATMSLIFLVSRLFDGVTDPLIGNLSDRTRSPIGRRKPWIIGGSLMIMLAAYQVFLPPANAGAIFFATFLILLTLGWTIVEIPYSAWVAEITGDYNKRTLIQTYRSVFALVGGLAFSAVPLLPIFKTTEMTPDVLRFVGWAIIVLLPVSIFAALFFNKEGKDVATRNDFSMKALFLSVKGNRPYQIYLFFLLGGGLYGGITGSLNFFILDVYLGIGDKFSFIMIPSTIVSLAALPIWFKISSRIGKSRALATSLMVGTISILIMLFIKPGPDSFLPFLALSLGQSLAFGAFSVVMVPMLADVIDYDILKTGVNRSGQYISTLTLITKCNAAFGGALGFFLVGIFGFDPTSTTHSTTAVNGLLFTYIAIPILLGIPGAFFAWRFPITKHRQRIIRKRIEQKALRMKRAQTSA